MQIIADFLGRIQTEFLDSIQRPSGAAIPPIEFWFTLPATWSSTTRVNMLQAIHDVGFLSRQIDKMFLTTDAVSAASYNFHAQEVVSSFKVG